MSTTNRKKQRRHSYLLLFHFLVVPAAITLLSRLIWGTNFYGMLGLIAVLAWWYMYGITIVKDERKDISEQQSYNVPEQNEGEEIALTRNTEKTSNAMWVLRCKSWLHCLIIPCIFFIVAMELLYPDDTVFIGFFGGLGWMFFFGGRVARNIIATKKQV